jgi:CDP-diacylglycerol---glycerol-3-phosphate 3-phosphatidyltransferase
MSMEFGPTALATPANGVTVARLLATPVVLILVLQYGTSWLTVAAWFTLSCTDGVDGWLARRHGTTRSGAFLDPLADKFLVLGAMFALVIDARFWWLPVAIITIREFGISLYRSWVARQGISVPARPLGKAKTVVQDLAVGAALLPLIGDHHPGVAVALLYLAVVLTVVSGAQYIIDGRRVRVAVAPVAVHPAPPARAAGF